MVSTSSAASPTSKSLPTVPTTSSMVARASATYEPSGCCVIASVSSSSCSSAISPTICSTMSSIEARPSVPPYSSTTSARWMRVACMRAKRSITRIDGVEIEARRQRFLALSVLFRIDRGPRRHESDKVADVHHAYGIVERVVVDNEPGMRGTFENADQFADIDVLLYRNDIRAWNHDVAHPPFAQPENVLEHPAFFGREAGFTGAHDIEDVLEVGTYGARLPA